MQMKIIITIFTTALLTVTSCDVQSEIAKKSVEKYAPSPTPSFAPKPVEEPIDPADVVNVDTSVQGNMISIYKAGEKKRVVCDKYNQVMVNNDETIVTIDGVCRQIMINGNRNDVTAKAATEIVFNGSENTVRYSHYANGKRPLISDNKDGNTAEKISEPARK